MFGNGARTGLAATQTEMFQILVDPYPVVSVCIAAAPGAANRGMFAAPIGTGAILASEATSWVFVWWVFLPSKIFLNSEILKF